MGIGVDLFYASTFAPTARYLRDPILAFNARVEARPVLDNPDLALYVNVDESGVWAYKGDQGFGSGKMLAADPNAIPGLLNSATGPARPFIGASGGFEIALSNPVPRQDMTGGAALGNGNAVGGYQKVTNLTTDNDQLSHVVNELCVAGDEATFELEVKGTAGQVAIFRIARQTGGAYEATAVNHTFSGSWETITITHTFIAAQTAWRVDMGRASASHTATEFEVRNLWARKTKGGGGRWPMQNLGGFTYLTLPDHLSQRWGIGLEYDPDTGKPKRLVTGVERGELVNTSTTTAVNVVVSGATKADRTDYVQGIGDRWPGIDIASGGATWNRCNFVVGKTVTSGQTYVGVIYYAEGTSGRAYVDCRNVAGATSSTLYCAVGSSWTFGGLAGTITVVSDTVLSGSVRKLVFTFVPNFTGTCEVGFGPHSAVSGETVIMYATQFAQGASEYPFMPVLLGGQAVHAAQKIEIDARYFAPLGPDVYGAMGQGGAIGSGGSPWASDTGEGRFSLADNVLTLTAGSGAETVSLDAPTGLTNGNVSAQTITVACTAGSILVKDPSGATRYTVKAGETRVLPYQSTIASDLALSLYSAATGEGTITINAVRQVQSSEATLFVDRTVGALGLGRYITALQKDSTSSSERFLELRQPVINTVQMATVIASADDNTTLDGSVATGDRQRIVASRSASEMTGKAQGVTAPAANAVGAVDDFAKLRIGTNGWNGGDADAGDIHAFAVFSRVLTASEHGEIVD